MLDSTHIEHIHISLYSTCIFKPQPSFPDCAFLPIAESTGVGEAGETKNLVNSEFVVKMASLSNR